MNPHIALPDLRLGLGAWGAFILATCAYCLLYQVFVAAVTPDLQRTFTVALREWGAWALLAPLALRVLREPAPWRETLLRYVLLALAAASLPVLADQWTQERSLGASLALYWPRNLAVCVVLLFIARARTRRVEAAQTPRVPQAPAPRPSTLLVSKGAHQCLIRIEDVQHLSAAGNYVDIRARQQNYLIRATMAELEALLPPEHFLRIHRSHIVRVRDIERIEVERSGHGSVHLRDGASVAISRGYRAQLKAHQAALKASIH